METGQEQMPTVQKQWYFHPESNGPFTTPDQGWMDFPLVTRSVGIILCRFWGGLVCCKRSGVADPSASCCF